MADPVITVEVFVLIWLQAFLIGIVVPDPDILVIWAKKKGLGGSYEELCKNKVGDFFF